MTGEAKGCRLGVCNQVQLKFIRTLSLRTPSLHTRPSVSSHSVAPIVPSHSVAPSPPLSLHQLNFLDVSPPMPHRHTPDISNGKFSPIPAASHHAGSALPPLHWLPWRVCTRILTDNSLTSQMFRWKLHSSNF